MNDFEKIPSLPITNHLYITAMFPYPSGAGLHCGHWYNYAVLDSYCNYKRYLGYNVFQPFGYDSFGLPAENYAKQIGGNPRDVTYSNIEFFRTQVDSMSTNFEELLITSNENYISNSQWLFTKLKDAGLAYKKKGNVNWCPSCSTVLANEQVKESKCDRCSSVVTVKSLDQWYFKITDYKDRLIQNLDVIDYPSSTINAQRKWLEDQRDWCVSRQRSWGCPIPIEGETDTLDTFVDSSFYTIIYSIRKGIKPKPVDLYVGGKEHACMHLIYARFITMALYDLKVIDFEEPFKKVIHQGMILNQGKKISKSLGNTVDLSPYNSDTIRFYLMFIGPYTEGGSWDSNHVKGITKFIRRWKLWMDKSGQETINLDSFKKTIFNHTENFKFNKVVSEFMILLNKNKNKNLQPHIKEELRSLLKLYMPNINE